VLSGVFYLAAVVAYLRFNPTRGSLDGRTTTTGYRWRYYGLAAILFVCALLSKTVTASMPAAVLLLRWWKGRPIGWRDGVALTPLFLLGAAMGALTGWMEKYRVGASGPEWDLSFVERCLIAGRALWFYAGKLVWPVKLTFIYPRWRIDAGLWWPYLFPLAVPTVVIVLWALRKRIGKAPLVAVLYYAGTLVPALGFVNIYPMRYAFVADHFQYLASIGLIALLVGVGTVGLNRLGWFGARVRPAMGMILLTVLGALTWNRGRAFKDEETLWRDTLAKNPDCWMAHSNLGSILQHNGRLSEAVAHYTEAARLKPGHHEILINLGSALDQQGRGTEAIGYYAQAIRLQPNDPRGHFNLGIALVKQGQQEQAAHHFTVAVQLQPDFAEAHDHLAELLAVQGKVEQAIRHYQAVIQLRPDWLSPLNNLAWLLVTRAGPTPSDTEQAIRLAQRACEATAHKEPLFLDTLAAALASAGRYAEAVTTAERAHELATAAGRSDLAGNIRRRLERYRAECRDRCSESAP